MKQIDREIARYEQQIAQAMQIIQRDFQRVAATAPKKLDISRLRETTCRINAYCADVLAYREKIRKLRQKEPSQGV